MLIKMGGEQETLRHVKWAAEGKCFSCGNIKPLRFDVGAMSSDFKACEDCIRRHGVENLGKEADRLLDVLTSPEWRRKYAAPMNPTCFHCRKPTLQNLDGTIPLMCSECFREYKNLFSGLPVEPVEE